MTGLGAHERADSRWNVLDVLNLNQNILCKTKTMDVHKVCVVLLNILAILLMFVTLQVPLPDENHYPLQHRLFENFYGEQFCGRDVFSLIS